MIKFSEIPYSRPDIGEVKAEMQKLTEGLRSAASYEEARDLFVRKDALERHLESVSTVAQIRHSIDTRDEFYDQEVLFWNKTFPELQEYLQTWTEALLASPFRKELEAEFGDVVFLNAGDAFHEAETLEKIARCLDWEKGDFRSTAIAYGETDLVDAGVYERYMADGDTRGLGVHDRARAENDLLGGVSLRQVFNDLIRNTEHGAVGKAGHNSLAAIDAGVSRVVITLATALDGQTGTTIC